MSEALLEIKNIYKSYKMGNKSLSVLDGISFTVHPGEFLSIEGPSGAGKSTLLYIMSTLDLPTKGEVLYNAENTVKYSDKMRALLRRKIGFVFQFYHLLPEFSVIDNIKLAASIDGTMKEQEVEVRANYLLDNVGLAARKLHRPYELSGGEQQRAAIARALIRDPEIIFADEPTGNLDSKTGEGIKDILLDLNKQEKKTLVVVTHDKGVAKLASRSLHIVDGKIKQEA